MVHDSGLPPDPPRHLWWVGDIPKQQLERLLKHPWDFVIPDSFGTNFNSAHAAMWNSLYATPLVYKTGTKMVYSDINFLILGKVIEKITGMPLAEYLENNFYKPLGMTRTMFVPPLAMKDMCAPTEYDSVAGQLIQGYVHDENSRSLGGAVGHAGLFSTAYNLGVLIQMMQNGGVYDGRQYLKDSVIALFTRKQSNLSTRALGWDTKAPRYSSAGSLFSPNSWGHLGFTGTSIWVDPVRNLFVIFLTNRVCPTRNDHKIGKVRPIVGNEVIEALEDQKQK
jgi:CubicO group peptidase (beta-lactamase class C family)